MALLRTDVSNESIASIIRVKRIGELGAALVVPDSFHPGDEDDKFLRNVGSDSHAVSSQMTVFFILTATTTSNPIYALYWK
jgi:hypothetical protein